MPKFTLNHTLAWVFFWVIFLDMHFQKKTFKKHTRKIYTFFYVTQNCHITPFHTNNNF